MAHRGKKGRSLKIPSEMINIIVVVFVIFLLGGGLYDILYRPGTLVEIKRNTTQPVIIAPSGVFSTIGDLQEQSSIESLTSMMFYTCGFTGLFMVYRGATVQYDRSKANALLVIGMILALAGYLGLYYLYTLKIG